MNKIIKKLNSNFRELYLIYIIFGLSIAIFFKDINLTFFKNFNFEFIYIYRILLIILSSYLFLYSFKKNNLKIIILLIIHIIFLYNSIYSEKLNFSINTYDFLNSLYISPENFFIDEKIKIIIINVINILFPVLIIMCINFKINFNSFYKFSYKVNELYLIFLSILIIYKILLINLETNNLKNLIGPVSNFNQHFINPHGLFYVLNIFFIQILIELNKNINVKKNSFYLFLIFSCFYISGSILFILLCLCSFFLYSIIIKKKIPYYIFLILTTFFSVLFFLVFSDINIDTHGSLINSLYLRFAYIKFFLVDSINLNFIWGNNIFFDKIYTYPHNFIVDIIVCCGVVCLIALLIIILEIIYLQFSKKIISDFLFIIFFQLLIFSLFSGFFFVNISLNILLAIIINLSRLKEEKIM